MTPIESQLEALKQAHPKASADLLRTGAYLIAIPDFRMPIGWNREIVTILFVAPPGYPAAQPDCFWVEPVGVRLANGATPQSTNDSNPIPDVGQRGTWFSWHLQHWNPNHDSLLTYLNVIKRRFSPPR